jgi:hypothetical protein
LFAPFGIFCRQEVNCFGNWKSSIFMYTIVCSKHATGLIYMVIRLQHICLKHAATSMSYLKVVVICLINHLLLCVVFCRALFVLFVLFIVASIVLSVLRYTDLIIALVTSYFYQYLQEIYIFSNSYTFHLFLINP